MPDPSAIQGTLSNIFGSMASSGTAQYLVYFGYILYALLIVGFFFLIYLLIMFKYKVTIFEGWIDKDENGEPIMKILKTKRDKAMLIKDSGVPKWRLLFGWKKISPVNNKYIQPGNQVFLFSTGQGAYNPMPMKVGNPSACFDVDPFDASFFNLGVQQDAKDYQRDDVLKRAQITFVITVIFLLAFAGFILWLSFRTAASTTEEIGLLTKTIEAAKTGGGIFPN